MQAILIGVIGSGLEDKRLSQLAYETGKEIALREAILICGGLGGVMEAAARGAFDAGGITIGILPGSDKKTANPYIKIPIATNMGHARNAIIAQASDALVAVGGSYGTLSEISLALKMEKPVAAINPPVNIKGLKTARTPKEAVEYIFSRLNNKAQ